MSHTFCCSAIMWRKKMACWFLSPLFLSFVWLTGAMQQPVEAINLYHPAPDVLHKLSHTGVPVAVALSGLDLVEVSSTVLKAEAWLRAHVLAHYPATRITSIVVGHSVLCNKDQAHNFELVLPSLNNMFWSLKRWGLEQDIRLTASFSSSCFNPGSDSFREDLAETVIKPVLTFIQATNSSYSTDPFSKVSSLVSYHSESLRKMGFLSLQFINVVAKGEDKTSRKLISVEDSKYVKPYPARPTPLPEISPIHSSIGYSSPAIVPKLPSPPASSSTPPIPHSLAPQAPPFTEPPLSHSPPAFNPHPPQVPPFTVPVTPTYGHAMPPCSPIPVGAAAPTLPKAPKESSGLWCVAKPNVPAETLQVGLDYACGAGGADCQEIKPYGSCFYPNSAVAHASYAFNSYWQKHKKLGGSCSFGGTAMLINADPSFMDCRFVLN